MATQALATLTGGTSTPRTAMVVATNPARVGKSSCAQFTHPAYSSSGRQRSSTGESWQSCCAQGWWPGRPEVVCGGRRGIDGGWASEA